MAMWITAEDFASHVAGHAGVDPRDAELAARAVLGGLGAYLSPAIRGLVADELPAPLRDALGTTGRGIALPLEERVLPIRPTAGQARELVASVLRVLAEGLSGEAISAIRAAVPSGVAEMLAPPDPELVPQPAAPARHDTLAAGRPGSHKPLSEAGPVRTHADSVAAANPHGDSKLSSAPGTTQVREHDTFAEGRESSSHPLSGSRRD
jgi:uncharacterized protein (DUF2267 family)